MFLSKGFSESFCFYTVSLSWLPWLVSQRYFMHVRLNKAELQTSYGDKDAFKPGTGMYIGASNSFWCHPPSQWFTVDFVICQFSRHCPPPTKQSSFVALSMLLCPILVWVLQKGNHYLTFKEHQSSILYPSCLSFSQQPNYYWSLSTSLLSHSVFVSVFQPYEGKLTQPFPSSTI